MTSKHGKIVAHHEGIPPISSHNLLNMCSREVTQQIRNISTFTLLMVTRLIRMVTCCKMLPPINLHDPSVRWSCEVMLQILYAGLRQTWKTWKTWKKQCFLCNSGKTWKTQGILRKYFKFLENPGNYVEIY